MISGFYAYQADYSTIIRRLRKIFRITLFATLIYIFLTLQHMIRHGELFDAFTAWNIARAAVRLIILSDLDFAGAFHLWFLCSLIEGYIILLVIKGFNLWKAGYICAVIAFIATGVIYALAPLNWHLRGNVFMSGISWIMTGHYIAENLQTVSQISRKILLASAVAGYLLGLLSLTGRMMFVSSVCFNLFPISLFILAVSNGSNSVKFPPSLVKIGAEYSLYVYLFHVLVGLIYFSVLRRSGISENVFILWTRPVIVAALSLVLSFVIVKVRDKISRKKSG